ncbi:hypothetical protein LMG26841_00176 [Achromobacter dolens]|uniref:Uncharacterized protein n=1 Tax=Achromobacter dolens TaxID=1287738 RepID=A0A6S7CLC1_9BURK|nr:hypothetical protein LMG26840_04963 [Achromobacter dolens]CAB3815720.1 hypothetical protein LMG26841_00176 [Achromobacter dolens]
MPQVAMIAGVSMGQSLYACLNARAARKILKFCFKGIVDFGRQNCLHAM